MATAVTSMRIPTELNERYSRLPKAAPDTVTLSLKVPAAMKRALEKEAKAEGKSTGAYARGILADGLMAIA